VRSSIVWKKQYFFQKLASTFGDQLLLRFVGSAVWYFAVKVSGSLQAKFHLCPRRQMPTTCMIISLDVGKQCISIPWVVLWSLDQVYGTMFIHSYEMLQIFQNIPPKLVQNGL
jgi:hypothetical protein